MWLWVVSAIVIAVGFVAFTGAPYVPSKRSDLRRAFTELYPLGSDDMLVDIGSGDGVVLREASRHGARAIGYEIHPALVLVSKFLSRRDPRIQTKLANFWHAELPAGTTVVYTFGEDRDIARMYDKVQSEATRLGRHLAFVSYAFEIKGRPPTRSVGAHHLYDIEPLHNRDTPV